MRRLLSVLAISLSLTSAGAQSPTRLKEGDILFQYIPCGPLCDAIAATTPCAKDHPFNHCGIVVRSGDSLSVLEAIGKDVHTTPLAAFVSRDTGLNVYAGRLSNLSPAAIRGNLDRAKALTGRPYDESYLPGDSALYCSELIYESFLKDGQRIFRPEPMSFKSADGTTDPGWTDHYRKLGQEIPEGLPGTNPCALSRHPAVRMFVVEKKTL